MAAHHPIVQESHNRHKTDASKAAHESETTAKTSTLRNSLFGIPSTAEALDYS